jgi:hypothetical protein
LFHFILWARVITEAFHAWVKINPTFSSNPLPKIVEEGLAQLVAYLFLNNGFDPSTKENEDVEFESEDVKLRQYFKYCIETDKSEVYGNGFRSALCAFTKIGIQELLYYVALNHNFPGDV